MANLIISDSIAERLKQLSARERRPIDDILDELLSAHALLVEDRVAYLAAMREVRLKRYAIFCPKHCATLNLLP